MLYVVTMPSSRAKSSFQWRLPNAPQAAAAADAHALRVVEVMEFVGLARAVLRFGAVVSFALRRRSPDRFVAVFSFATAKWYPIDGLDRIARPGYGSHHE